MDIELHADRLDDLNALRLEQLIEEYMARGFGRTMATVFAQIELDSM